MAAIAAPNRFEIGVIGPYSAGRQLIHALTEQGVGVVAYDCGPGENVHALPGETPAAPLRMVGGLTQLMGELGQSRTIVISGPDATGSLFAELLEQLKAPDLVIDAGNCNFKECNRRARTLAERNVRYLDLGIIGGGAVVMAGSRPEVFHSAQPLLESMAARGAVEPRVSHLGPAPAGHFVKMIFDAIEFSLSRLGLEAFDLLKRALDLAEKELPNGPGLRPSGPFNGHGRDEAARWSSQVARELNVPTPTIDAAAGLRRLSELEKQNHFDTTPFRQPLGHFGDDPESIMAELRGALHAAIIITYAQGMAVVSAASEHYGLHLDLTEIIRLWRRCCVQRGALLDEIAAAIQATPHLGNLLDDDDLSETVMEHQERLRHAVWRAGSLQTPVPALLASLDYLDSQRGAWLPVNLIQAPPRPPRPAAPVLR